MFFICLFSGVIDSLLRVPFPRLALAACQFTFTLCYVHVHAGQCNSCSLIDSLVVVFWTIRGPWTDISSWSASTVHIHVFGLDVDQGC